MAEIIFFNIPAPTIGEDAAVKVYWFQSIDGDTWDTEAVDSILVANLPIDTDTGKYRWDSSLVDPDKHHLLKTESVTGVMSSYGVVTPPRAYQPIVRREINNYGQPLVDFEGQPQEGVKIRFRLIKNGIPVDVFDTTTRERIMSAGKHAKTNVNGEFSIQLWPTDRGPTGLKYLCHVAGGSSFEFSLPSGLMTAVKWSALT